MASWRASLSRLRLMGRWQAPYFIDEHALSDLCPEDHWRAALAVSRSDWLITVFRMIQDGVALSVIYLLFAHHGQIASPFALAIAAMAIVQTLWLLIVIRSDQLARRYPLLRAGLIGQLLRGLPIAALFSFVPATLLGLLLWEVIPIPFRYGDFRKNGQFLQAELQTFQISKMNQGIYLEGRVWHYGLLWMAAHRSYPENGGSIKERLDLFSRMLVAKRIDIFDAFEFDARYRVFLPMLIAFCVVAALKLTAPISAPVFHGLADLMRLDRSSLDLFIGTLAFPIVMFRCTVVNMVWMPMVAAQFVAEGGQKLEPGLPEGEVMNKETLRSAQWFIVRNQLIAAAIGVAGFLLIRALIFRGM